MKTLFLLICLPTVLLGASGHGYLVLNNGSHITGTIRFDENQNRVSIHYIDSTYSFSSRQVKQFEFMDSQTLVRRVFLGSVLSDYNRQKFFELVLSGTITLLRVRSNGPGEWLVNHPRYLHKTNIPERFDYYILHHQAVVKVKSFKKVLSSIMGLHWKAAWEIGKKTAKHHHRLIAYILAIDHYNLRMDPNYQVINQGYLQASIYYLSLHGGFLRFSPA